MNNQLMEIKGNLSPVGWLPPDDLTIDEHREIGRGIGQYNVAMGWIVGDWLNFDDSMTLDEAMELTGYEIKTLQTYKSITRSIPFLIRVKDLSYKHHRQVAKFRDDPEKQTHYLGLAESKGLSARALADRIREDEEGRARKESQKDEQSDSEQPKQDSLYGDEQEIEKTDYDYETEIIWTDNELERKGQVLSGQTVTANKKTDEALIQWAKDNDLYVAIDRGSIWGNPFLLPDDGTREEVVKNYEWYYSKKPSLQNKIDNLRGKVLGCWCYPENCHGNVLARELNENLPLIFEAEK